MRCWPRAGCWQSWITPELLRIFDVGIYDGRPYLVLEYVSGRNLEQHFAERKPTPREAARLMAGLARVVAYAHRRGVIHGDIKPQNVLIDGEGRARLIDFGTGQARRCVARESRALGRHARVSASGTGGLRRSRRNRAREAADVFGLGATLYWLLTGRSPFAGASAPGVAGSMPDVATSICALNQPGIPRRLAKICRRALAADPRNRPNADQWAAA